MYLIATSHVSPSKTVYYSSLAGKFAGQQTYTGSEVNSTLVRGYLHAILQGLKSITNGFGVKERHAIDVLVADAEIAEQLAGKRSVSKVLHRDDDNLWKQLLAQKELLDLRFITSHEESKHVQTIWRWSSTPPLPASL
jgi:hypothetical protein